MSYVWFSVGYMFHGKPLYVAIAQRKEDRQAQLQLQYAHRIAGLAGPSTGVMPAGYPSLYYTAPPGVVSQVPPRPGLMYQPLSMRPGWRSNGFAPPTRPNFQLSQFPSVSNCVAQQLKRYFVYFESCTLLFTFSHHHLTISVAT